MRDHCELTQCIDEAKQREASHCKMNKKGKVDYFTFSVMLTILLYIKRSLLKKSVKSS
jgi:hypothetical protein